MNRESSLYRGQGIAIMRFFHAPGHEHVDPREEEAVCTSLNLLEAGSYRVKIGRRTWELHDTECFITRPGMVYHSRHVEAFPQDVFFSICYDEAVVDEVYTVTGHWRSQPVQTRSNRSRYMSLRLQQYLLYAEAFTVDLLARELLASIIAPCLSPHYSVEQLSWYFRKMEQARELMDAQYADTLTLQSVAQAISMSPYHFARIFSELVGMPPHRYLLRQRLQAAAGMLREGASVTTACFDSGFNHHSHFSRSFKREFGCVPSVYREDPAQKQ